MKFLSHSFKSHLLSEFDGNRQNNFTVIRILLAWFVLYGHSYALQNLSGVRDPLNSIFQGSVWIGELAVNGFFIISGFLVTASFVRRGAWDYLISRILRIYPALIVCILVSVFLIGPVVTSSTLGDYFSRAATFEYLRNMAGVLLMKWQLPGVFEANKLSAVNGSLWTLTVEIRCYLLLCLAGVVGVFRKKGYTNAVIVMLLLLGFFYFSYIPLLGNNPKWSRPAVCFLAGVLFYVNRDKIILDTRVLLAVLMLLYFSFGSSWYGYLYPLLLAYIIFCIAYLTLFFGSIRISQKEPDAVDNDSLVMTS